MLIIFHPSIAICLPVALIIYMGYKQPKIIFDTNSFRLKGLYGVSIPYANIVEVDTITLREIPAISIRTNGISLFKVHRGHFRTTDGEKVRLSINSKVEPIIKLIDNDNRVYYINRKDDNETLKIVNELKTRESSH